MRSIDTVLFDLDDTLIDWSEQDTFWPSIGRPHAAQMYRYVREQVPDLAVDQETFIQRLDHVTIEAWMGALQGALTIEPFGVLVQRAFGAVGLDAARIDLDAALEAYGWTRQPRVSLFEDTVPVLDRLRDAGFRLGLITNSHLTVKMRRVELEAYGIADYFEILVTSGDAGYVKPHPGIFEHALSALERPPEHAMYVGDSPQSDVVGAQGVGMTSVLHEPPHLNRPMPAGVEPHHRVSRLRELLELLDL